MNLGQKILAFMGVLGLLILLPVIFYTFGSTSPMLFLEHNLGTWVNPSTLTFIAFCMIGTMALLGGGKNFSATLLSLIIGFLFVSTAVEISFLAWFKDIVSSINFLSNLKLNLLTGVVILLFGMGLSFVEKVSFKVELLALVVLPLTFLIASSYAGILPNNTDFNISMNEGINSLKGMIDSKYLTQANVQRYVAEVSADTSLTSEEKVLKMEELQQKIARLEQEEALLNQLKSENEHYKELVKSQEEKLKEYAWCAGSSDSSVQVKKVREAVVPNQPCVRDFAVSIVKEEQGAYYDRMRCLPGAEGIRQICRLHEHLANNWKYISDPTMIQNDYFSPANRTIALGLAGDCDDFAVLNASCVEAIGGISRIMGGACIGGGHAWAEVLIGFEAEWERAANQIRSYYKDKNKTLEPIIAKDGTYWLSLDWRMGEFSCNDYPSKALELYTSIEQFKK